MALTGRALADAYVRVRADMSQVAGDVTRGMDQAASRASKATSRKLKDGVTAPFKEGFAQAARDADPGGQAVGGRLRQGLIGKLRAVTADTTKAGKDAGTGLDRGIASKMGDVAATATKGGKAAGDGIEKGIGSKTRDIAAATTRAGGQAGEGFTKGAAKTTKDGGAVLNRIGSGVAGGLLSSFAAAAVGMAAISLFTGFISDARESIKIGKLTEQVIKTTGGAARISADGVSALATAISNKTGVDDEAIQSGENLLLTFTNIRNETGRGNDIFNQATGIITDMSVALGTDMKSSAIQVGKALQDPIKGVSALQRVGVSFTESQKQQIKTLVASGKTLEAQKIILRELGTEFGGAAAAAATPVDRLRVIIGNLGEQIGTALIPPLDAAATVLGDDIVPAVSGVVSIMTGIPGPVYAAVAAFVALRGAVALVGKLNVISSLGAAFGSAGGAVNLFKNAGASLVGLLGGPWGIAIAGAAVGIGLLVKAHQDAAAADAAFRGTLNQTTGALTDQSRAMITSKLQQDGLFTAAQRLGISIGDVTAAAQGNQEALTRVNAVLGQYTDRGAAAARGGVTNSTVAKKLRDALADQNAQITAGASAFGQQTAAQKAATQAMGGSSTTLGQLIEKYPTYKDAIMAAVGAAAEARGQDGLLTGAELAAGEAAGKHAAAVDKLTASLQANNNVLLILRGGETGYFAALDAATAAVKENGRTMDVHSAKGRANRGVLDQLATAGLGYLDVIQKNNGVGPVFRRTLDQQWQKLYQAALRFGATKRDAKSYADQIYATPKALALKVTTPGLAQARGGVKGLAGDISRLSSKELKIALQSAGDLPSKLQIYARLKNMWTGGYTGDGGKYEPKGVVHGGEFVVPKEQTARIGAGNLAAMVGLPGYARGGPVVDRHLTVRGTLDRKWPAPGALPRWVNNAETAIAEMMSVVAGSAAGGGGPVPGGAGVARWGPMMSRALAASGLSLSLLPNELRQIATESGGNPNAVQGDIGDVNNASGDLAKGLMQVIGATFRAYHVPGTSFSVFDPWANMMASLSYQKARYGGRIASVIGHGHGYAGGTENAAPGWQWVGENGRELVRFHGGEQVKSAAASRALDQQDALLRLHPESLAQLGGVLAAAMARTPILLDGRTVAGYVDRSMGRSGLSVRG